MSVLTKKCSICGMTMTSGTQSKEEKEQHKVYHRHYVNARKIHGEDVIARTNWKEAEWEGISCIKSENLLEGAHLLLRVEFSRFIFQNRSISFEKFLETKVDELNYDDRCKQAFRLYRERRL